MYFEWELRDETLIEQSLGIIPNLFPQTSKCLTLLFFMSFVKGQKKRALAILYLNLDKFGRVLDPAGHLTLDALLSFEDFFVNLRKSGLVESLLSQLLALQKFSIMDDESDEYRIKHYFFVRGEAKRKKLIRRIKRDGSLGLLAEGRKLLNEESG